MTGKVVWSAASLAGVGWSIGYGPSLLLPSLLSSGWNVIGLSCAVGLHVMVSACCSLYVAAAHRRFGAGVVSVVGVALAGGGLISWASASAVWHLAVAGMMSGMGWSVTGTAAINSLIASSTPHPSPAALARALNGLSVGGLIFAPAWTWLISMTGASDAAFTIAAIGLLIAIAASLAFSPAGLHPSTFAAVTVGRSRRALLRERSMQLTTAAFALCVVAVMGIFLHLPAHLATMVGLPQTGFFLSLTTGSAVCGRLILSRASRSCPAALLAAGNFAFMAAALGLLTRNPAGGGISLALGCAVFGCGVGGLNLLPTLIARAHFEPEDVTTAVGVLSASNLAALAVSPLLVGLQISWGGMPSALMMGMVEVLCASVLCVAAWAARSH